MCNPLFYKKKVLITAGPTREAIDPVRYISNHSSGKMGFAIAKSFLGAGATVILISGPVNLSLKHKNLVFIPVISALEMQSACNAWYFLVPTQLVASIAIAAALIIKEDLIFTIIYFVFINVLLITKFRPSFSILYYLYFL